MAIKSTVFQLIERKKMLTAYISFFQEETPQVIIVKSCFQSTTIEGIHEQIIAKTVELEGKVLERKTNLQLLEELLI